MKSKKKAISQPVLPISCILVSSNLRRDGWEKNLDDLIKLIKDAGLKQPPGVRALPDDKAKMTGKTHELVFGFRRFEACKRLGYSTIPVTILPSNSSNKDAFVSKLVENFGREDLSPLEEADALKRAMEDLGFTAKELAERIGKTSGYISQRLSLLKMPDPVQKAVQKGEIGPTHARELARVTDEKEQAKLLEQAKHLPMADFKEKIEAASSKKQTSRGRKTKPEKSKKSEKPEIAAGDGIRSKADLKKALDELDAHKKKAAESGDKLRVEFLKGMMRGIGWAGGMVKQLVA